MSVIALREKCPYSEFCGSYFPAFGYNKGKYFSPNVEKYGPEKLRIRTHHAV